MSKPLVYVDQNVIGLQLQGKLNLANASSVQWVYSKEHFAEIRRSSNAEQYLVALDRIDAKLLELESSNWKITGAARLVEGVTAEQHYLNYCDVLSDVDFNENLFDPFQVWVNGGGDERLLRELPSQIAKQILVLTEGLPHDHFSERADALEPDFSNMIEQMVARGNDIDRTREAIGVGKGAIGGIAENNQILQIWEIISPACGGVTSDQFFGFDPHDKQGYESWPVYLGIVGCCAVLDIIGFQAEKKCRKIERIPNVRSDSVHIAMGSFCSAILSADKRLSRRAKAIYEYRNIGTASLVLDVANNSLQARRL